MIKQLFTLYPKEMRRMLLANMVAIAGFFLLYQPFSPRPYSNLVYFFLMLTAGIYLAKDNTYQLLKKTQTAAFAVFVGIALMLIIYGMMRYSYSLVSATPALASKIDTGQWRYFVQPWLKINRVLSVSGVLIIVLALEFFHRAYIQEFFAQRVSYRKAIFAASLLSGIRGLGGGYMGGPIDFMLCLIWGWVYHHGGLWASVIVHLSWDICFVYFPP